MRIELEEYEVPEDRFMKGRVFFDLREPVTVDSIGLDVNKTFATVSSEGVVKAVIIQTIKINNLFLQKQMRLNLVCL